MAAQIQRAIVKGKLLNAVNWRAMFVAQVDAIGTENRKECWEAYVGTIYDDVKTILATSVTIETIEIQKYDLGQYEFLEENPYVFAGTGSGDEYANLVAAVLIGKCVGQRLMGRKFISGLTEAAIQGNGVTLAAAAFLAQAAIDYTSLLSLPGGSTLGPGIVAKDGSFHTFYSGWMSSFLGTMRRRKPGVGI